MPRPSKCRRVCAHPRCVRFDPRDAELAGAEPVVMRLDEYECVRLLDYEGLTQEECAARMGIARTTVTAIYMRARRALAEALVRGRPLLIRGGEVAVCARCDGSAMHGCEGAATHSCEGCRRCVARPSREGRG